MGEALFELSLLSSAGIRGSGDPLIEPLISSLTQLRFLTDVAPSPSIPYQLAADSSFDDSTEIMTAAPSR
jgi:hypothetical protein